MHKLLLSILLLVVLGLTACGEQQAEIHLTGRTMGTSYNVKYLGAEQIPTPEQLQKEIDAALELVNEQMSTYRPHSELSQLNQIKNAVPIPVSADLYKVLKEAKRLGEMSDGYLDVTVGPLVNLWGFGPQAQPEQIPALETIKQVKNQTGLSFLQLQDQQILKLNPELYVDLSTIAKGFGVDQVADILEARNIDNYLVEIGGEMRLSGFKANNQPWRVAVEKPVSQQRAVQRIITVGNNAIATAGDYRNYYEKQGKRYSHLIDPKTGYPIQHNLVSVTVIHPSSMTADGLATAINVMGPERGLAMARSNNLPVLLITKENGEFVEYTTPEFEPFLQ